VPGVSGAVKVPAKLPSPAVVSGPVPLSFSAIVTGPGRSSPVATTESFIPRRAAPSVIAPVRVSRVSLITMCWPVLTLGGSGKTDARTAPCHSAVAPTNCRASRDGAVSVTFHVPVTGLVMCSDSMLVLVPLRMIWEPS
jgi:hypothetical protein